MLLFTLERSVNNMTTQESMGLKIKGLREDKKLSQSELAALVGYKDKTAIAKVEAGKVDLPQSKISAFAKALNTTTSYLFSDEADEKPVTIAAHFDGDDYTAEELDRINEFAILSKHSSVVSKSETNTFTPISSKYLLLLARILNSGSINDSIASILSSLHIFNNSST